MSGNASHGPQPTRVLVVDDEANIVDLVRMSLRFHGFDVVTAACGDEAIAAVTEAKPDLMVLDVLLSDTDGFEVCRRLRDAGIDIPVIFLTARDRHADKIVGLTCGGDDYVTKPFSIDELVARVRAVLRRTRRDHPPAAAQILTFADVILNEDTHEVTRDGHPIELSPTEFKLLRYLLTNPRRVLSRVQVLDAVWNYDFDGEYTIVDQYVSYLRRKLAPHGPPLIHTQRGFGYMLREPGVRSSGPGGTPGAGGE
ncbi:response regulator transcription factor [Candidatus Protofrankia californiensis]|uniref:response regulator transcription factor n=1 Tax=Candidatus Protofrankia californiensis TaxID=1839754 RepID=UPI001040EACB|nr:response regulator transcription factor [Candidatus Protofrankia californiensis]